MLEKSTPSEQTNFKKQRIEITFDEWVTLSDVFKQVVISPPLASNPEITLKGKTLRFDFAEDEVLRDSATYTINFGEAIKDLTEKNPAENLRFVFATGPFIDSLEVQGEVVDAFTGEVVEGALFMLYENKADSVVRTVRPFYFAKTDKQGKFKIQNVKPGSFKGFALVDADFNYLFSQPNERIAFPDSLIVSGDSTGAEIAVRMFTEELPLRINETKIERYGLIKLFFNRKPTDLVIDYDDVGQNLIYDYEKDSLRIWYDIPDTLSWNLYVRQDTFLNDTIAVKAFLKTAFLEKAALKLANRRAGRGTIQLNPEKEIQFSFNHPLAAYDTAKIRLLEDTLKIAVQPSLSFDSLTNKVLKINYPWKEEMEYELQLLPGALTDIFGLQNDTIQSNYKVELRKKFGNLNLTIIDADSSLNYIVQLFFKETSLVDEFQLQGNSIYERSFTALAPGEYTVQVVTDYNGNGRWDTGNYDAKRQPEPILQKKLETLRANWDLEAEVRIE